MEIALEIVCKVRVDFEDPVAGKVSHPALASESYAVMILTLLS